MRLAVNNVFWNVGFRFLLCWFLSFGCCLFLQYFLLALDHLFLQFFFFFWGGLVDPKRYQVWWCLFYNVKLWGIVILRYYCILSHYFLGHSFLPWILSHYFVSHALYFGYCHISHNILLMLYCSWTTHRYGINIFSPSFLQKANVKPHTINSVIASSNTRMVNCLCGWYHIWMCICNWMYIYICKYSVYIWYMHIYI